MTDLAWKLNRLRAMGPGEIFHRGRRWMEQQVEARQVARGKTPLPAEVVGPGMELLPPAGELASAWLSQFELDEHGLSELLEGRVRFFGHEPLAVGNPVQWHHCPLTGTVAPRAFGKHLDYRDEQLVGNVKFLWELGRHQHLVPLAAAYAINGHDEYAGTAATQIESWITDNPYGIGIHWCSALEVALRLISWALVHALIASRDGRNGLFDRVSDAKQLGRSIYQQARFVRGFLSRYSSANNHLIGELTGLLTACRVFDLGRDGQRWATVAHRELEREAQRQVHDDGVDREQALYYHLWVLEYLLFAWSIELRANRPFAEPYRHRLETMTQFLLDIRAPDGEPPQIGDADDGMVARFEPAWPVSPYGDVIAAAFTVLGNNPDTGLPPKAFWYRAMAGSTVKAGQAPVTTNRSYPRAYTNGGYAILGGKALHLVFDAGPLGYPSIAAHGHADALSVCIAVDGCWWLVDPGTYVYHSEAKWRNYFRGTSAHNTLRVDHRDQSTIGGPFLWTRHAKATLTRCEVAADGSQWAEGRHEGYSDLGVVHERTLCCASTCDTVEISDSLRGRGNHFCELYYHFAPGLEVTLAGSGISAIARSSGTGHTMHLTLPPELKWELVCGRADPPQGWYSAALEHKQPAQVLVGAAQLTLPVQFVTKISLN